MIAAPNIQAPAPAQPAHNGHTACADPAPIPDLEETELKVALALVGEGAAAPPIALAAQLGLELAKFLQILARTHVRQWIDAAIEAEGLRQQIVEGRAKVAALETLTEVARDTSADPVERRRAASAILRALARPRAPRAICATDRCSARSAPPTPGARLQHPTPTPDQSTPEATLDAIAAVIEAPAPDAAALEANLAALRALYEGPASHLDEYLVGERRDELPTLLGATIHARSAPRRISNVVNQVMDLHLRDGARRRITFTVLQYICAPKYRLYSIRAPRPDDEPP